MAKLILNATVIQWSILTLICFTIYYFYLLHLRLPSDGYYKRIEKLKEDDVTSPAIFFIETSFMEGRYQLNINNRQACSVESAAHAHPKSTIYVLFLTDEEVSEEILTRDNAVLYDISELPNVQFRLIDLKSHLKGTPLYLLYRFNMLSTSQYLVSHTSDVLRYATLYKFPGTYLDLDVIVLKTFSFIKNYAVKEKTTMGSSVLNFGSDTLGRQVAKACAEDLSRNFDGSQWITNGPAVITNVLKRMCNVSEFHELEHHSRCQEFILLPTSSFFELFFSELDLLFNQDGVDQVIERLKSSMGVHVWNALSSDKIIPPNDLTVPYNYLAFMHCPNTYSTCGGDFNVIQK